MRQTFILLLFNFLAFSFSLAQQSALDVSGKAVVFYEPTRDELSAIPKGEDTIEDFHAVVNQVRTYLQAKKVKCIVTSSPVVRILLRSGKKATYERRNFHEFIGAIFTDGKREPRIVEGLRSDGDLVPIINRFYGFP